VLDRPAYEDKTLQERSSTLRRRRSRVLRTRHNQLLSEVFGIQTVPELGSNKHFAPAGVLVALATKLESRSVSVSYPGAPSA
jgi:hypothetical protein